ncbi:pyridoxal-dependent decarboxylase [Burkholderia pseudomallei]|nr:pyridoxal-dependent decarboxylase [Burkholderia pseudomallei]
MVDVGDDGDVAKGAGHRNLKTDGTRKRARTAVLSDARALCSLESLKL